MFDQNSGDDVVNRATDASIEKVETTLKLLLPISYKELMKEQNGGSIRPDKNCHSASPTSWTSTHVSIGKFSSVLYLLLITQTGIYISIFSHTTLKQIPVFGDISCCIH